MLTIERKTTALAKLTVDIRRQAYIVPPFFGTKDGWYRKFAEAEPRNAKVHQELKAFVDVVMRENFGESWTYFQHRSQEVADAKLNTLPNLTFYSEIQKLHEKNVEHIASGFQQTLEAMVGNNHIGRINWFDTQSCRFSYFLAEIEDRGSSKVHKHMKYVHDVVNAQKRSLSFGCPQRVRNIINAMPHYLKPYAYIVTGQEVVREATVIQSRVEQIQSTKQEYRFDPALVLGDYVLAGWL